MKTGLTYSSTSYEVNGPTTKCVMTSYLTISKIDNLKTLMGIPRVKRYIASNKKKFTVTEDKVIFVTSGITTCKPTDKYDEQTGRNIARTKAQAEAFITLADFLGNIFKTVSDIDGTQVNCIMAYIQCRRYIDHAGGRIEEYSDEEYSELT